MNNNVYMALFSKPDFLKISGFLVDTMPTDFNTEIFHIKSVI